MEGKPLATDLSAANADAANRVDRPPGTLTDNPVPGGPHPALAPRMPMAKPRTESQARVAFSVEVPHKEPRNESGSASGA